MIEEDVMRGIDYFYIDNFLNEFIFIVYREVCKYLLIF